MYHVRSRNKISIPNYRWPSECYKFVLNSILYTFYAYVINMNWTRSRCFLNYSASGDRKTTCTVNLQLLCRLYPSWLPCERMITAVLVPCLVTCSTDAYNPSRHTTLLFFSFIKLHWWEHCPAHNIHELFYLSWHRQFSSLSLYHC